MRLRLIGVVYDVAVGVNWIELKKIEEQEGSSCVLYFNFSLLTRKRLEA